ncbi:hypothetical protein VUR80DRAFT_3394 [Thermomyces stellatus]
MSTPSTTFSSMALHSFARDPFWPSVVSMVGRYKNILVSGCSVVALWRPTPIWAVAAIKWSKRQIVMQPVRSSTFRQLRNAGSPSLQEFSHTCPRPRVSDLYDTYTQHRPRFLSDGARIGGLTTHAPRLH